MKLDFRQKIIDPKKISSVVASLKEQGKRVVSLNGSFDLLHAGHLEILYEAKKQGDILVVALNTDESIQVYKSKDRPIVPLNFRLQMMAAIEAVDLVTYFSETTPIEILKKIHPHVHVNGAEYGANCIESETVKELGAILHLVNRIPSLSTSAIVKKIKSICD
jgi:rfaE bifunctional protein nucleotidyltransferase chain/domain